MRIFLDNKGVGTLWSQFKAKLAAHADDSNIHVTAEEKASWNGKAELSDIPTSLPANGGIADTARETKSANQKAMLFEDNEGGNLKLVSPDGNHSVEMDLYNNEGFRMYFTDNGELTFPVDYNSTTKKFNINGNADTVDGKHASDFALKTDIPTTLPANGGNADTAKSVESETGKAKLHEVDEGGQLLLTSPDGTKLVGIDMYENDWFRMFFINNGVIDNAPFNYDFNTRLFNIRGSITSADTLDGKHADDFALAENKFLDDYLSSKTGDIRALVIDLPSGGFGGDTGRLPNITGFPIEGDILITWSKSVYSNGLRYGTLQVRSMTQSNLPVYQCSVYNDGIYTDWQKLCDGGNAATVNGYTVNANVPAGFSSIGQNTENKTYTYRGTAYTGHNTSEVFNNYTENMAANEYSHAEGYDTKALGDHSHAEGSGTKALGFHSHAECSSTEASGDCSHAEGMDTTASGDGSHAEGSMTTASSSASHAEGSGTRASGNDSHAEGSDTKASGSHSHAEGSMTEASGESSHAEGLMTGASSSASHAEGYGTIASSFASHAGGKYSKAMTNSTGETDNTGDAFVIGNGTEAYTLSNAFRVTYGGAVYGLSAFNSSGADYAEFIKPWYDGNTEEEDRVGYFVTIKDGLLYKANEGDYIVGITSGNPSVVGNADEDYYWRYARDEFNRFVYEDAEEEVEQLDDDGAPVLDENGMPVMVKTGNIIKNTHYKLAADYNPTKQNDYIERKNRPEWSYVGMVGVIPVRDDGTCEAGCFCKCGQNGIATRAESRGFDTFFVIERLSDNVVSVEIR